MVSPTGASRRRATEAHVGNFPVQRTWICTWTGILDARSLRVAVIRNKADLGAVPQLLGKPDVVDLIKRRKCDLVVNTPEGGSGARSDGYLIREAALVHRVPCITTISGAAAAVHAIANARAETSLSLQERIDAERRSA